MPPTPSHRSPTTPARPVSSPSSFIRLVTLAEVIGRTGLSALHVEEEVRRGRLHAYCVGDLFVFRLDQVERLANGLPA